MRGARNEQGVVAVMMALIITVVMIPIAALAVDIGMQRVARRDMQSLADVVALDLARQLDGTKASVLLSAFNGASGLAVKSADRNMDTVGDNDTRTVVAQVGTIDPTKYGDPGYFTAMTGDGVPTAVRVTASTEVGFGLARALPGGGVNNGHASRSAIASAGASACYKIGSFALGLATNKSILGTILGDNAALRVISYDGLTTANVSLLGLAAKLGAGTPDALLNASNISVGDVLDASASLLASDGSTAGLGLASQLGQVKSDLGPLVSKNVDFGQILDLGQGNASALDADVNVLDIITGGLIAADGVNGVAVPNLNLAVGALGTLTAKVYITAPPKIGCNGGGASTAQGSVKLSGKISLAGLATLKNVDLTIDLANASEKLDSDATCVSDAMAVDVYDQTLANVRLQANIYALGILGLPGLKVGTIDTGAPTTTPDTPYSLPIPDSYTTPVATSSGTIGLDLTGASINVLGIPLGGLLTALAPLVNGVSGLLTHTLLPALGLTTDGADLWALPTPTCQSPRIVG